MSDAPRESPKRADTPEVTARVREGMDLVGMLARQLRRTLGRSLSVEELESFGHEGLLSAARGFDPEKGVPFRRWANLRIRGAILDGVRANGGLPRRVYQTLRAVEASDRMREALEEEHAAAPVATAEAADARLSQTLSGMAMAMAAGFLAPSTEGLERIEDRENDSPEQATAHAELLGIVRRAIAARPEAERKLLERHYFDGVSFDEAAREIGLSKSWASRLHARAIEALVLELRGTIEV